MLELNKIYNMDCIDGLELIDDNTIDLVVIDPPYEVDYHKKAEALSKLDKARTKQIERDKDFHPFKNFRYLKFCNEIKRKLKNVAHVYVWTSGQQMFKWHYYFDYAGFEYSDFIIWLKNRQTFDMSCGYHYNYKTENCILFTKGKKKLNKVGLCNVYKSQVESNDLHPTQKPVNVIRELIRNSSNEGDTVLDCFMGSGTTAVACKSINRNYIGFELSKKFCDIANSRVEKTNEIGRWF